MNLDIQLSLTGEIAYEPRYFPSADRDNAMWSATLKVNGSPAPSRDGGFYIPTRFIEVAIYGLAAMRAQESYHKGDLIIAQGCDLYSRTYTGKDDSGKPVTKAVVKVIATALGLCSRYTAVHRGDRLRPATPSVRLVQGASAALPAAA